MYGYAYPPTPLIPRILQKLRHLPAYQILLVTPFWPRSPWFALLVEMAIEDPWPLPSNPRLLSQVLGNGRRVFHSNPALLNLHEWRLCKPL